MEKKKLKSSIILFLLLVVLLGVRVNAITIIDSRIENNTNVGIYILGTDVNNIFYNNIFNIKLL